MTTALLALAALAIALAATWLHYVFWVRRFSLELDYESVERVGTADGCAVELRRLPEPLAEGGRHGPPILLVHGLALNHRNHDMREDLSLGRHLSRGGRDVWLVTLRSGRADLSWAEERRASFERMARHDVVTAIDAVLERTGAACLDYVGFSMGGMLLYAAAGNTVDPRRLRRVAIIGSPARIEAPLASLARLARLVPRWIVPTVRLRLASRLVAFAVERLVTPIHRWIYNPANVEPGVPARALVNGFVNIPRLLAAEIVGWAADGKVVRHEGRPVTETLRRVDRPVLFVAGAGDRLAPPPAVALAHEAWGADVEGVEKSMRIAGIEQGAAADYGHGDLAIGRFAEQDVFEPVAAFLARGADEPARV